MLESVGASTRTLALVACAASCALGGRVAAADPPHADLADLINPIEIGPGISWSTRLADKMTLAGDQLALHVRALTFDAVDLAFDGHTHVARVRLAAGRDARLSLRIDGDIAFQRGYARVATRLQLGMAGKQLRLSLPDVDVVPREAAGQRVVEVRLPVVDFRF